MLSHRSPPPSGAGSAACACAEGLAAWAGLIPFFAFLGLFLVVPTVVGVPAGLREDRGLVGAGDARGDDGPVPATTSCESLKLSAASSIIGGLVGTVLAHRRRAHGAPAAVAAHDRHGVLAASPRTWAASSSPSSSSRRSARQGVATKILDVGRLPPPEPAGSPRSGASSPSTLFFQIPLMFLVMLPAIDGLQAGVAGGGRPTSAAPPSTYWRRVGIPVLAPAAPRRLAAAVRQRVRAPTPRRTPSPPRPAHSCRCRSASTCRATRSPARPTSATRWPRG